MAKKTPTTGKKRGRGRPKVDPGKLNARMRAFIAAYLDSNWNVTTALEKCQLNRSTFYGWKEKCPAFAEAFDDATEARLDLAEDHLTQEVKKGNIAALCFFLKCQGKARGYIERVEHTGTGGKPIEYQVIDRFEVPGEPQGDDKPAEPPEKGEDYE